MIRLVRAEVFKLRTIRLYGGLLAAATCLVVLVTAAQFIIAGDSSVAVEGATGMIETDADLRAAVLDASGVGSIFALVLGVLAVAGEHRHHTITSTYLLTPRRSRAVIAKLAAYTMAGIVFGIVIGLAALAVTTAWLAATGAAIPFGTSVLMGLGLASLATGLAAGLGVGIGAALPNQLGAVLVAVGWVMVAEQLIAGLIPGLANWLPFSGASTAITGQHPDIGVLTGIAMFLAYLAAVAAAGITVTQRRDIA